MDSRCSEKKDFMCMKMSASKPAEKEVLQDIGCKIVCCLLPLPYHCIFTAVQQFGSSSDFEI